MSIERDGKVNTLQSLEDDFQENFTSNSWKKSIENLPRTASL